MDDWIVIVIIVFVVAICIFYYYQNSDALQLKCVVSSVDGNQYCVRDRNKVQEAADLLAKVTTKCKELVNYMETKHPDDDRTKRLVSGFNPKKIMETLPTSFVQGTRTIRTCKNMGSVTTGEVVAPRRVKLRLE